MTRYVLDANVFIEAKNRYYGFDFCPAFWEWLLLESAHGHVVSIEKVGDELRRGTDRLSEWVADSASGLFLREDAALLPGLGRVAEWTNSQPYWPSWKDTFFESADYYLVAHALVHGDVIVTHERPDASPKRVKIPDACLALGIKFVTPWVMLGQLRARFVLGESTVVGR